MQMTMQHAKSDICSELQKSTKDAATLQGHKQFSNIAMSSKKQELVSKQVTTVMLHKQVTTVMLHKHVTWACHIK